ncbi:MAG: ABC transporter permease [Planctomycetota bacterium]|nr:ABC transporter permease [Planctomycetota bacterium]
MTRIRASAGWQAVDLSEMWRYRELLIHMAMRDIKIRYKQTVLGASWAVIQPLMTMLVFSQLFSMLMPERKPTVGNIPYSVSTFCALLGWQLFAGAITQASGSLVQNQSLITKIYFPRLIVPCASILVPLADFGVGFCVLLLLMLVNGVVPGVAVLALPLFILLAVLCAMAVGLWLCALNALYRDFRYITPFIVQAGMFITPVVYTYQSIEGKLTDWQKQLYCLNPLMGVVEGFRWSLLGTAQPPWLMMLPGTIVVLLLLVSGTYFFRRVERTIADVV